MNFKYNETQYGKLIYESGFQSDFIKYELLVLVKYLKSIGYNKKDTEKYIYEFCRKHIEGFNEIQYFKIIDKAIRDGRNKNSKLIDIKEIIIIKNEIEYIDSLDIEHNYKKLLLAFLVRKKLALEIYKLSNPEATLSTYFNGSKKSYKEVFDMANIERGCKVNLMVNELVKKEILVSIIKGDVVLDFINNINYKSDEVYEKIKDFENVGCVFDCYKGLNSVKKCERFDECGSYIIQTTPNKKYCSNCAKDIDREKAKERMRNIRMFEATDSESIDVPKV